MNSNRRRGVLQAKTHDGQPVPLDDATLLNFRSSLRGSLLCADDPGYDRARAIWNGMIDKQPALIARCIGTADVIASVNFARAHRLLLAIRGGGHNVAGNAMCDGALVIDLSMMRGVHVDPKARTARVQGGATLGDIDRETQIHGFAVPFGVVSNTGIAGLTLGGGTGWLMRKHGLTIDNLLSVEIVTADSKLLRASEAENTDLFWAVRGGGGNFGVATSFEFRVHQHSPMVMLGAPFYSISDAAGVLSGWRDFMAEASEEMSGAFLFWTIPNHPDFPLEHRGQSVVVPMAVYNGTVEEGERLMAPLRSLGTPLFDLSRPVSWLYLQGMFDPFIPNGARYYWKSLYVDDLGDESVQHLVKAGTTRPAPDTMIILISLGGAVARVSPDSTAFGRRDMPYLLEFDSSWNDAKDDERNIVWTRKMSADTEKYSHGGYYLNFPGLGEAGADKVVRSAVGPANFERLVKIKNRYDPYNLFRVNMNIRPTV